MKTAVQWLIEKLEEEELIFNHGLVERWKHQALEMEKIQIKDSIKNTLLIKDEILDLYLKKEKELNDLFKPILENQEYAKAKEMGYNDLNLIRRFITHLKRIK